MPKRPGPDTGALPWLDGFEQNDYSRLWDSKRIEAEAQTRILTGWVKPGESYLDLGGGFGRVARTIEPFFHRAALIDLTKRNLGMAKKNLKHTEIIRGDVSNIPARDSSFDFITMIRVVHLLPDPSRTMREILRVSKDEGILVMSVPNLAVNCAIRDLDPGVLSGIRHILPTYGPVVWPYGQRCIFSPHKLFVPKEFKLTGRRGTGLFDNFVGKSLNRFPQLHLLDVATSPFWFIKLDVFLRFEIRKSSGGRTFSNTKRD